MTKSEAKPTIAAVNELFSKSPEGLREIVRAVMQEMLEAEMTDALGAEKGERTSARLGYRSGYYSRTLVTRVGKFELRVPQDRDGRFSTDPRTLIRGVISAPSRRRWRRSPRWEPAPGLDPRRASRPARSRRSPRGCAATPSRLPPFPPSISAWTKASKPSPRAPLPSPLPISSSTRVMRRVREGGVVMSQAVLIAIGIDWDGRRQ